VGKSSSQCLSTCGWRRPFSSGGGSSGSHTSGADCCSGTNTPNSFAYSCQAFAGQSRSASRSFLSGESLKKRLLVQVSSRSLLQDRRGPPVDTELFLGEDHEEIMFDHETIGEVCSESGERSLFQGKGGKSKPPGSLGKTWRRAFGGLRNHRMIDHDPQDGQRFWELQ
jgi:hypothetical protein